jgi:hypothetical protein
VKKSNESFLIVHLLHTQKSRSAQLAFQMIIYFLPMQNFKKIRGQVVVAALCISGVAITTIGNSVSSVSADATTGAGLRFLGRWTSGSGLGGAEISAYDAASQRLFVTNGKTNQIDIVDISKPGKTKKVK